MAEDTHPSSSGTLFIVGTPIGNLADITLRAIQTLSDVAWIAAEDTRHTARLLKHHALRKPMISYHEHNETERAPQLLSRLQTGQDGALVTDAGTPGISDPGYRLVRLATDNLIPVVPIPGVSAAITALSASGLPSDSFLFQGFLPKKKGPRQAIIKSWLREPRTLILYESPRRVVSLLNELHDFLGDRRVVIGREMTKRHEEFLRGPLKLVAQQLVEREKIKGEITVLVDGFRNHTVKMNWEALRNDLQEALLNQTASLSTIAKQLSQTYPLSKSDIYNQGLEIKNKLKI